MEKKPSNNKKQEFSELLRLAHLGNADSQFRVGEIYRKGEGIEKDSKEAAKWLLKASEQGNPQAQYRFGRMLHSGEGVEVAKVLEKLLIGKYRPEWNKMVSGVL